MAKYFTGKKYGHDRGLSCAFRQWRATHSHCSKLHGYSIAVEILFECEKLDDRNWGVDYGGMDTLKIWLETMFDHKTLVAKDDPEIEWYREGQKRGVLDIVEIENTGCERMAEMIYNKVEEWVIGNDLSPRVKPYKVTVWEHEANSASYQK